MPIKLQGKNKSLPFHFYKLFLGPRELIGPLCHGLQRAGIFQASIIRLQNLMEFYVSTLVIFVHSEFTMPMQYMMFKLWWSKRYLNDFDYIWHEHYPTSKTVPTRRASWLSLMEKIGFLITDFEVTQPKLNNTMSIHPLILSLLWELCLKLSFESLVTISK